MSGWIGVDLDGTAAFYDGWRGIEHIGAPIAPIITMIKAFRAAGTEVRWMTARCFHRDGSRDVNACEYLDAWSLEHVGEKLPITNTKDSAMIRLYDDRARQVLENEGLVVEHRKNVA